MELFPYVKGNNQQSSSLPWIFPSASFKLFFSLSLPYPQSEDVSLSFDWILFLMSSHIFSLW